MRYWFAFLLLVCVLNRVEAQLDTAYIKDYRKALALKGYVVQKSTSLQLAFEGMESEMYMPNSSLKLGLGAEWRDLAVSFAYGFSFMHEKEKGNTKSLDLQFHYYGRKFVVDLFGQNYKGFYMQEEGNDSVFFVRPDIKVMEYGVFGQYVFNGNRFSYDAAFNQSSWQKKSAGSFLLGAGVYYSVIQSDSIMSVHDNTIGRKGENFQIGPSLGYAYSWVIKKRFFITASLTVGVNAGKNKNEIASNSKIEFYPTAYPRMAAGYNANTWAMNVSVDNNTIHTSPIGRDYFASLSTMTMKMSFLKRFEFKPKLKPAVLHNFLYRDEKEKII